MADPATYDLLTLTSQIVAAHVTANKVTASDLPALINGVYGALATAGTPRQAAPAAPEPAVPIKRSVQHDYLVCLEDGAKVKMLKRYIQSRFGLTPDAYRAKWGLAQDYPMVAPAYAATRSRLAKQFGLGTPFRLVEPSAPEERHLPVEEEPAEPEYTVSSVFANFPGGGEPSEAAVATEPPERPGRKRFAQQSMREGRRRAKAGA